MKKTACLGVVVGLLVMGQAFAAQWELIAPGVERLVHADGTKEYRQHVPSSSPPSPAQDKQQSAEPLVQSQNVPSIPAPAPKIYKYTDGHGVVTYQTKVPQGFAYTEFKPRVDCFACMARSGVNWETTPLFRDRYEQEIQRYASRHGVSPALVKAVIHAESAFNPKARSKAGAQGLMQLMPGTAAELGVASPFDPAQNIDGGVRYLAMLLKMYNNDMRLATAAYNAGPGAVRRYNGVPNYAETKAYVQRVAILERRYRQGI